MGLDAAYQWRLAENFDLGIATGYQHFFLKSDWKMLEERFWIYSN